MHKGSTTVPPLRRSVLRRALRPIEWLGFSYRGRRHFWAKQAPLLRLYLEDPGLSSRALTSIHRCLQQLGIAEATPPAPLGRCQCRVLGVQLLAPCLYRQCSYWGNYPSLFNCVQAYLGHREAHNLSIAEMAVFSGYSRVMVHNLFTRALTKLRDAAHADLRDESFDQAMQVIRIDGVCIVCGQQTELAPGVIGSHEHAYTYCSFACWARKRPQLLALEERFGVLAIEVIASLSTRFTGLGEAATCLNLTAAELEALLRAEAPTHPFLTPRNPPLRPRLRGHRSWQRQEQWFTRVAELLQTPALFTTPATPTAD
jgi:hypothetical protein